ncbi:MAG TPA: amidohydrolase [Blastocatellia bacterium]|nr:amidohydrolase [Blastocatellia bacterium]
MRRCARTTTGARPADLLITGGMVVTMDSEDRIFDEGAVAISGERILAVGEARTVARDITARRVISARGKVVLPGLINAHTHAPMTLFRGLADDLDLQRWLADYIFPAEKQVVTRSFVYWGTLLACLEMLQGGITTFADMYYFEEEVARAVDRAGMRAVVGQTILDLPSPDSPTSEQGLRRAERLIRAWRGHRRVTPAVAPHAIYTSSPKTLQATRQLADKYGVPLLLHLAETEQEVVETERRHGARPIAYLDRLGVLGERLVAAHVVHVTDDELALLQRRRVGVAHNPQSNMKLGSGVAPVTRMVRAGVAVGLGTDGAASNNALDLFTEMKVAALLQKVHQGDPQALTASEALRMATRLGARALGLEAEIGSLEVGKMADLILVNMTAPHQIPLYNVISQLVYACKPSDVGMVIVGGKIVMAERRVLTVPEAELRRQVERLRRQVCRRLGLSPGKASHREREF